MITERLIEVVNEQHIECSARNGPVVASYVASENNQIMLVTNPGKLIRIRVNGGEGDTIRVVVEKTQGVRLFDVDEGEKVVSVALLNENDDEADDDDEMNDTNDQKLIIYRVFFEKNSTLSWNI